MAAGPETELRQAYTADQVIDCDSKVLMLGLINTHFSTS